MFVLCAEIDMLQFLENDLDSSMGSYLVNGLFAIQIPLFSRAVIAVAESLTETENHQTESVFIDNLIFKVEKEEEEVVD
jgi:hypothetical protein